MIKRGILYIVTGLLMSITVTAHAQPLACPALVEQALDALGENCDTLGRNTVCYGYDLVNAAFSTEVAPDFFTQPADTSELTTLQSIRTAALDLETERWGIALMNAQANVPNTIPGQAVTFILLGDTVVNNQVDPDEAAQPADPVDVRINASGNVNVRSGPGTNFNAIELAIPGNTYAVDGRNQDGTWLRISVDETLGWISRSLTSGDAAAIDALPVVGEAAPSPMQAFYFTTGIGTSQCEDAPDALVIQGPQDVEVALNVNGLDITIGSTVVLTSVDPDGTATAAATPAIESPFGPDAPGFLLSDGVFVYPGGEGSLQLATDAAPDDPGLDLTQGVFINPVDDDNLLITTDIDADAGIDNAGAVYVGAGPAQLVANQPADGATGAVVPARVYIQALPDDSLYLSIDAPDVDATAIADLLNAAIVDDALLAGAATDAGIEPGCRTTQITVLDGAATLNGGDLVLPVGNRAQTETCIDEDGAVTEPEPWEDLGEVPQSELAVYGVVEDIPPTVVRYAIRIPSEQDIQQALITPTPFPLPERTLEVTVPTITPPAVADVDCSAFRGTSPTEGMAFGTEQFFWDPAPGADFYRVVINATDRPGQVIADVGAPMTNLSVDIGIGALDQFGRGTNFQWRVQAWKDSTIACETTPIAQLRELVSRDEVCRMLGGQMDNDICYGRQGEIFIPD